MTAWWRRQDGMVTVLAALAITAIVGFSAVSLDVGRFYLARGRLRDVGDAAALAGAAFLPEYPAEAQAEALSFTAMNGVPEGQAEAQVEGDGDVIQVTVRGHLDTNWGRVLGVSGGDLSVSSVARVCALSRLEGSQPLGVEIGGYEYGELVTVKLDTGGTMGPEQGNFHALAMGGQGAANYRDNLAYGYDGWVSLGEEIATEPGNMEGPTRQGVQERLEADPDATYLDVEIGSPRLLLVPTVETFDVQGRKYVKVIGFAVFFLEGYSSEDGLGVQGRFLHMVVDGPAEEFPEAPDWGLRVLKLL